MVVGDHDGIREGLGDDAVLMVLDGEYDLEAHLLLVVTAVAGYPHGRVDEAVARAVSRAGAGVGIVRSGWRGLPILYLVGVEDDDPPLLVLPPFLFLVGFLGLLPVGALPLPLYAALADPYVAPVGGPVAIVVVVQVGLRGRFTDAAARAFALALFWSPSMALVQTRAVWSSSMSGERWAGGLASSLGLEMVWVGRWSLLMPGGSGDSLSLMGICVSTRDFRGILSTERVHTGTSMAIAC